MHGARFARLGGAPGDLVPERPVDLERGRADAVAAQRAGVPGGQGIVGERGERGGHHVGDDDAGAEPLSARELHAGDAATVGEHALDPRPAAHRAAELLQMGEQCLGEPPGAALGAGPADPVAEQHQVGGGDRAARGARRDVGVHRRAVQPRAGAVALEQLLGERLRRHQQQSHEVEHPARPEPGCKPHGAPDRRKAAQHRLAQRVEVRDERLGECAPALAVARVDALEAGGCAIEVAIQRHGAAIRKRVRVADRGMDPAQAVALERQAREHGRGGSSRMYGREGVVREARQRQLLAGDGAAWTL